MCAYCHQFGVTFANGVNDRWTGEGYIYEAGLIKKYRLRSRQTPAMGDIAG